MQNNLTAGNAEEAAEEEGRPEKTRKRKGGATAEEKTKTINNRGTKKFKNVTITYILC